MSLPSVDNLQLIGPIAAQALQACAAQCQAWGVALPDVEPLVLDFGQGDFARVGLIEFWIANEIEAGYCGKYLFCFEGQQCPRHRHEVKHETFHIVAGCFHVSIDDTVCEMDPGASLAIPRNRVHGFTAVGGPALLLELSMPCDITDNHFESPPINAWLNRCVR